MPKIPMLWDTGGQDKSSGVYMNHVPGGSNVVWADGSAEFVKLPEFYAKNMPVNPAPIKVSDPNLDQWTSIVPTKTNGPPGSPFNPRAKSFPGAERR